MLRPADNQLDRLLDSGELHLDAWQLAWSLTTS